MTYYEHTILYILIPVVVSSLTTLAVYWLKKKIESNKAMKDSLDQDVMTYIVPIVSSLRSLANRLKSILCEQNLYLTLEQDDPVVVNNKYLKHMYISTLYRFCAVLGTITALEQEKTFHRFSKPMKEINDRLNKLKSVIAEGRDVDKLIAKDCIDFTDGKAQIKDSHDLPGRIENTVFRYIKSDDKRLVLGLNELEQKSLLSEIATLTQGSISNANIVDILNTLSRRMVVILRDMQSIIGHRMIKPVVNPHLRHFEVINLEEFETIYHDQAFVRVKELFQGIDFSTYGNDATSISDERYKTIVYIYIKVVHLLQYLKDTRFTGKYVSDFDKNKYLSPTCYPNVNKLIEHFDKQAVKSSNDLTLHTQTVVFCGSVKK